MPKIIYESLKPHQIRRRSRLVRLSKDFVMNDPVAQLNDVQMSMLDLPQLPTLKWCKPITFLSLHLWERHSQESLGFNKADYIFVILKFPLPEYPLPTMPLKSAQSFS